MSSGSYEIYLETDTKKIPVFIFRSLLCLRLEKNRRFFVSHRIQNFKKLSTPLARGRVKNPVIISVSASQKFLPLTFG